MSNSLKSGVFWSVVEVVIKRSLDLVVKLILARLLFPEDFGVIGMATVFTSFIQVINEAGMGLAIIQKQNLTNRHLNTVFWTNIVWSSFLYLLLSFVISPLAAKFYDEPLLTKIIPILSISILASSLNTVHYAQLRKELKFKKIAFIRNISTFVAGAVAISMAYLNFGVWSLIANDVIATLISVPLFYASTKWLPKFQWDKKALMEVLSFGLFVTGTSIIGNLVGNADYLLLGRWAGSAAVGTYTIAYMMTNMIKGQVTTMIDKVMYPFYSSIQDNREKQKSYYLKTIKYYAMFLYPIMLILILFSDTLIPLLFSEKWNESILPLKILALAVMINALTTGYNLLFRSAGLPKYEFKIKRITAIFIYLPALVVGIYFYGIIGAAMGVLISDILILFVNQYVLKKYFEIKFVDILKQTYPIILLSLGSFFIVYGLRSLSIDEFVNILIFIITFTLVFVLIYKHDILKLLKR